MSGAATLDVGDVLARHAKTREAAQTEGDAALSAAREAQAKMLDSAPPPQYTPPQQYSGAAMAIAALGGLLTHTPVTTAANAMAGVLDAYQQGDAARSKQAFEQWKTAHAAAEKMMELEFKTYDASMRRLENDPRALLADLQAQTAAFKNEAIGSRLASGDLNGAISLIHAGRKAAKGLGSAGTSFTDAHTVMSDAHQAEIDLAEARKTGDMNAVADAEAKVNDARGALADAAETGQVRLPKGVTIAELRKPVGGGTISDEAADFAAQRVMAGDERATTGMARNAANVAKVTNAIVRLAKERGISPEQVATKIAEFQGTIAGERTLGTRTANMEVAANEVNNMAPLALDASKQVSRTDYPRLNSILIAAQQGTGDPEVVRFGLAANSLIYTYAKFLNPTGIPTDADKARATDILSTAWAEGQFEAAVDQIKKEIQSGRAAIGQTRTEFREGMTGKSEAPPAAAPSAKPHGDKPNVSDATLIEGAKRAIAAGATRETVIERLKAWGVDTGGI